MTQGSAETLLEGLMNRAQRHTDVGALCQLAVPAWVVAVPQRQKSSLEHLA